MKNIPKELHLYWDDTINMSELQTFTVKSFHILNPEWKIYVYTSSLKYNGNDLGGPKYLGDDYFYLIKDMDYVTIKTVDFNKYNINVDLHPVLRSDILRYNLLYDYGGVWSDFDVVWLKSMSHIKNVYYVGDVDISNVNSIVSFRNGITGHHSIGIMVHCKHDNYILSLIKETKKMPALYEYQTFGLGILGYMYPTFKSLNIFENIIGVGYETYYPYPIDNIDSLYNDNDLSCINNNVICVHWFNGHPLSKQYVNNDGFNKNCSMTTILKNEGYI